MKVELDRDIWYESIYVLIFNKSLLQTQGSKQLLGDRKIKQDMVPALMELKE